MVSGAPKPGGLTLTPGGGLNAPAVGGIDASNYRLFQGHNDVDLNKRDETVEVDTVVSRTVQNVRRDARATGVTYLWTLPTRPGGSASTVSNGTTATASFTPDVAGDYVFRCVVTFTGSGIVTENVTITAEEA